MSSVPEATRLRPTWDDLVDREPRLGRLCQEAGAFPRRRRSGARLDYWYSSLKPALSRLVGWGALQRDDEVLRSREAYDVAYDEVLYHCLGWGDCRGWCSSCRAERAALAS